MTQRSERDVISGIESIAKFYITPSLFNPSKTGDDEMSLNESLPQTNIPAGTPHYWVKAKQILSETDPVLAKVIQRFEQGDDPPLNSRGDLFYTLANAIVGQQISAAAAAAVWGRLSHLWEQEVTAERVLNSSDQTLRDLGLSKRKVEYLKGVAESMTSLQSFPWLDMTDREVIDTLCSLRGVGPWTAEMTLIFTLLRPDVLPLGDIGVIRAVERLYANGDSLSASEVELIAERWRPYRTVAVWYLWRTIDSEPVAY